LVEHRIRNAGVVGSNPIGGTIFAEDEIIQGTIRGTTPKHQRGVQLSPNLSVPTVQGLDWISIVLPKRLIWQRWRHKVCRLAA
jgi:hypothetical protein